MCSSHAKMPRDLAWLVSELRGLSSDDTQGVRMLRGEIRRRASRSMPPGDRLRELMDSEDLTQDVLLHLIRVIDRFEGSTWPEFLAFVQAVLEQCKIDLARYHSRKKRAQGEPQDRELEGLPDTTSLTASGQAMGKEQQALLLSAITELPDANRLVVESRLKGEDYPEIAAKLEISTDNARQRFSRGLQILRDRLSDGSSAG